MPRPKPATKPKSVPEVTRALDAALTTYESRIQIVEAWQYHGSLAKAPEWIDRNWAAYHSGDEARPPQPMLLVPVQTHTAAVYVGDYIAKQRTTLMSGLEPEEKIEVWRKDDFERLFIPKNPFRPQREDLPHEGDTGAEFLDVDDGEATDAAA